MQILQLIHEITFAGLVISNTANPPVLISDFFIIPLDAAHTELQGDMKRYLRRGMQTAWADQISKSGILFVPFSISTNDDIADF